METEESVTVRPARESDYEAIDALCTERFGAGYLDKKDFLSWLKQPKFFLTAEVGGKFGGFCYLMPEEKESLARYMKIDLKTVEDASRGKPVLHCRSAALVSGEEHRGVMFRLLSEELKNAKEMGFGAAFAPAWTYENKIPMGHLMDLLGFIKIGVRENLWIDQENYTCVVCGGRCRCQAVIYQKVL